MIKVGLDVRKNIFFVVFGLLFSMKSTFVFADNGSSTVLSAYSCTVYRSRSVRFFLLPHDEYLYVMRVVKRGKNIKLSFPHGSRASIFLTNAVVRDSYFVEATAHDEQGGLVYVVEEHRFGKFSCDRIF